MGGVAKSFRLIGSFETATNRFSNALKKLRGVTGHVTEQSLRPFIDDVNKACEAAEKQFLGIQKTEQGTFRISQNTILKEEELAEQLVLMGQRGMGYSEEVLAHFKSLGIAEETLAKLPKGPDKNAVNILQQIFSSNNTWLQAENNMFQCTINHQVVQLHQDYFMLTRDGNRVLKPEAMKALLSPQGLIKQESLTRQFFGEAIKTGGTLARTTIETGGKVTAAAATGLFKHPIMIGGATYILSDEVADWVNSQTGKRAGELWESVKDATKKGYDAAKDGAVTLYNDGKDALSTAAKDPLKHIGSIAGGLLTGFGGVALLQSLFLNEQEKSGKKKGFLTTVKKIIAWGAGIAIGLLTFGQIDKLFGKKEETQGQNATGNQPTTPSTPQETVNGDPPQNTNQPANAEAPLEAASGTTPPNPTAVAAKAAEATQGAPK